MPFQSCVPHPLITYIHICTSILNLTAVFRSSANITLPSTYLYRQHPVDLLPVDSVRFIFWGDTSHPIHLKIMREQYTSILDLHLLGHEGSTKLGIESERSKPEQLSNHVRVMRTLGIDMASLDWCTEYVQVRVVWSLGTWHWNGYSRFAGIYFIHYSKRCKYQSFHRPSHVKFLVLTYGLPPYGVLVGSEWLYPAGISTHWVPEFLGNYGLLILYWGYMEFWLFCLNVCQQRWGIVFPATDSRVQGISQLCIKLFALFVFGPRQWHPMEHESMVSGSWQTSKRGVSIFKTSFPIPEDCTVRFRCVITPTIIVVGVN